MRLTQLQVSNFRNIESIQCQFDPQVNLITGNNAAGKTSLLESIYYLSHLRSFRSHQLSDLIRRDTQYLQIFAQTLSKENLMIPMGIRRSRNKTTIRFNHRSVNRVSDIAAKFPVLSIHPDSYKLITGSPVQRRQYMDWGVFHVEQDFFQSWRLFRQSLAQRNAALKSREGKVYCQLWDKIIVEHANYIDQFRQTYIDALQHYLLSLAKLFFHRDELSIEYKRGWSTDITLEELLIKEFEKDKLKGYTCYGPHRAEIIIKVNGQSAQNGISRGQQKTLVALMRLAQAQHFTDTRQQLCILLYDDLAAELDGHHREMILSVLSKMHVQLFLTTIEADQIDLSSWSSKKMFHVEHGCMKDLI